MRIVAVFDPATEQNTTFNAGFSNGQGRIIVYNESNVNLQLSWDAFSTYCPAWTAMLYCISSSNVNINWTMQSQLVSNGAPISQVVVEALDANETVMGTYPAALVRQTNIGNSIGLSSSATSIANDGNITGTSVIEATVSGAPSSSLILNTDGKLLLAELISNVVTAYLQSFPGAATILKAGETNKLVEILGNLQIDQKLLLANGAGTPGTVWNDSTHVQFTPPSTSGFQFNKAGGSAQTAFIDETNGLSITSGLPLKFGHSGTTISAIDCGTTGVISGGSTLVVNHALAQVPDAVMLTCFSTSSTSTNRVQNVTSTQFTIFTFSSCAYMWLAIAK